MAFNDCKYDNNFNEENNFTFKDLGITLKIIKT